MAEASGSKAVMAFDRDGTLIGSLGDFEANHPKHLKTPECQKLILPVANWINENGGILISNQQGIENGYTTLDRVVAEFVHLHKLIPGLKASFFCPDSGESCWMVFQGEAIWISRKAEYKLLQGYYRKPKVGMFEIASDQFGELAGYVGDLSGKPHYGRGMDSDRQAAINAKLPYWDVNDFIREVGDDRHD